MIIKKISNIFYFYKKIYQLTQQFKIDYIFLIISILLVSILELFTFVSILILVDLILGNTNEYLLIIHKFLSIFWGQANNEIVYLFIITTFFIRIFH